MDWLDLLAVQGTHKSLLQQHSSEASILQRSAFFTVQLSHPYMTIGKTIALTRRTFVSEISGCNFPFAILQFHFCVPLKIPPQGRREQQLPSKGGSSEVEIGSTRQSGSRKPSCAGRKGQQRGEGERGMEVQSQGAGFPGWEGFWGTGCLTSLQVPGCTQGSQSPRVSVAVSPGRGGSGRGSYLE